MADTTPLPVVTIFEQYGAGAEAIGRLLAADLGLDFHGQAFASTELEAAPTADDDSVLAHVLSVLGGAYGGFEGRDIVTTQAEKYDLIMNNNRSVQEFADHGGVIVGRNAAVILADRPATVHVLLTGALDDRLARAAREAAITLEHAATRQAREDRVRAELSLALYGWDPRQPDRYDLVINTSRIPPQAAVAAILTALEHMAPAG